MRLAWITGRDLGIDLAATTEISLCRSMASLGVEVTLISPGKINNEVFQHVEVKKLRVPGLNTYSGALNIRKRILKDSRLVRNTNAILVDWRYVKSLETILTRLSVPWFIIDRGPPASSGLRGGRIRRELLRNLQKRYWKGSWKVAGSNASGGFVVSPGHERLVRNVTGGDLEILVIPAGAEPNNLSKDKTDPSINLKLVYVGRIDKKRGVSELIHLSNALADSSVKHSLTVVGEGDMNSEMERHAELSEFFRYLDRVPRDEIQSILAGNHIGILPMPDIPVWRIASPLKLAEYLAAGLLIVGPDHSGNRLNGGEDWDLLTPSRDWVSDSVSRIKLAMEGDWSRLSSSAIESSQHLQWGEISKKVIQFIEKTVQNQGDVK
jgi:glycosyltransferase involved in cell wall biosynthesis